MIHAAFGLVERIARMSGRLHANPCNALGIGGIKAGGKSGHGNQPIACDVRGDICGKGLLV